MSGDNFLLPALKKLCQTVSTVNNPDLQSAGHNLYKVLKNRFVNAFDDDTKSDYDQINATVTYPFGADESNNNELGRPYPMDVVDDDDEDDDDDRPVVVPNEEVEASLSRLSQQSPSFGRKSQLKEEYPIAIQKKYPILFAAKMQHEDILMTCARALDEQSDVSLVREAGTYLVEEVEPDTSDL